MKILKLVFLTCAGFGISWIHAQVRTPGPPQDKSILLLNGIAHIGNETVINRSAIGFSKGRIVVVSDMASEIMDVTEFDEVIDISGKHVYPGFILTNTTLGLREVDAVRATLDYGESGDLKPEVRSIIAYNTDSKIIPTVRRNGVLIAQPTPRGGMISGQSGIVSLDAWNWEDASLVAEDGIHVYWPSSLIAIHANMEETNVAKLNTARMERIREMKDLFERARSYSKNAAVQEFNLRCEAMKGLFDGRKALYLHVQQERDIIESVTYFKSIGVRSMVLVGASEGVNILDFIRTHNLPVILDRVHELPLYHDSDIREPFRRVKKFMDAGILVTISYEGDMEAMGSRNLPFTAGTTVAYGLSGEQAVQLITLNAAKILRIDNRVGSIEVGKDATLFVSEGDALDMISNHVLLAFIEGRKVGLAGDQEKLYELYMQKYGLKSE